MLLNTDHKSPNFDNRPKDTVIDTIIIHAMGYKRDHALETLCDPHPKNHGPVSAHYLIDHDGTVYALVDEDKRAWHAGVSTWEDRQNLNYCSIGIELLSHDYDFNAPFDERQINALMDLINGIKSRHPINDGLILGHDQIAPGRKTDPGPYFPWDKVRAIA